MKSHFRALERWLPRRLTTRMTLALITIVIAAGLVTTAAVNMVLARYLRAELIASGEALALALGESIANPLTEGDLAAVQESLNTAVRNNPDVRYAFAFGPGTPIVHTFPDGFPADLLQTIPAAGATPSGGRLLQTEQGFVRDFGYRPLDGLPAEVHLGISQEHIGIVQREVTTYVIAFTVVGCLVAAGVAYTVSHVAISPLVELTRRVERLGRGHLDERIDLPPGDEVGDLARAFNEMAGEIKAAMRQLQASEASASELLTAAGAVGEGIALICDEGPAEGTFLFVNHTFARLAGFEPAELAGANAATILHPDSLAAVRQTWRTIRGAPGHHVPGEVTLVDRHGQSHILETAGTMIEYQGRRALAWFTRDVSERKRREAELRRRNRELTALNAVASAVSERLTATGVLHRALREVLHALRRETGWLFILGDDGQFRLAASEGLPAEALPFAFPHCQCAPVLSTSQAVVTSAVGPGCVARAALATGGDNPVRHATVPLQARGQTLGVLSVASAEAFAPEEMALLVAVGQQIAVALENARLWDELNRKEQVRSELLARVIGAQEDERQRIARELHDGIGQSLSALVFGLNAVATALEQAPDRAATMVARLKVSASDTVKELQHVIYALRPSLLDDLGLCRALEWYARDRLEPQGTELTCLLPEEPRRLPPEVETALFRMGQEAITNIRKHARARKVSIVLDLTSTHVRLQISDDGVGFVPGELLVEAKENRGWGLLGMRERAALLGGELVIESQPGSGARLVVTLPVGNQSP